MAMETVWVIKHKLTGMLLVDSPTETWSARMADDVIALVGDRAAAEREMKDRVKRLRLNAQYVTVVQKRYEEARQLKKTIVKVELEVLVNSLGLARVMEHDISMHDMLEAELKRAVRSVLQTAEGHWSHAQRNSTTHLIDVKVSKED